MNLDIATDNASECTHEIVYLSWIGTSYCVCDTYAIDTNLVDSLVYRKQVDKIGPEGILGRESDFDALGFDKIDDLDGRLGDVGHVLSMRELAEEG